MTDAELAAAQAYALGRGLCSDIGPFRHLCTRQKDHKGKHQGFRQEKTDERVSATWGDG